MLVNEIKIFEKNKKTKNATMVVKDIKIFQKIKNKDQLSIEKIIPERKCS